MSKTVVIRSKEYNITKVGYNELSQLAKYVNALGLSNTGCLTPELDRAAAYALTKVIPTIDPSIANTETGIDLDFLSEFYPLYKELERCFTEKDRTIDVVPEHSKDEEIKRLMEKVKQLETEKGGE
jgi:hypothetical protein